MEAQISELIAKLGGDAVVAEELQIGAKAVWQWPRRRIPPSRVLDVFRLATRRGLSVSLEAIEAMSSRKTPSDVMSRGRK